MAVKDHDQFFEGIQNLPTPADKQVPNTVSRFAKTGDRAFMSVVAESGKPVLDAELNLNQDAKWMEGFLLRRWHYPSGWLQGRTHRDSYCDWLLGTAPVGLVDDSGAVPSYLHADTTLLDAIVLPRLEAVVAGHPVVVEYTNTRTDGYNLVALEPSRVYDGTNATVKRTDFLFLEVWRALVAPSPRATAQLQVVSVADLAPGDTININGLPLTAVAGAPAVDEFTIGVDEATTAVNIQNAINSLANSFDTICTARSSVDMVFLTAVLPGAGDAISFTGNFITFSVTVAVVGCLVVSGAVFTGGADRPNKPAEDQGLLYRHGNVLAPVVAGLDDEMVDAVVGLESSQRIQVQYRIRATGTTQSINYKAHPDGFSNRLAGPGPHANGVYAQGNRNVPVWSGNGIDTLTFPFVPADGASTWHDTSAPAFGFTDDGLWVAGNGTEAAAQALGSIDGFVYAIPMGFIHRHNNASDAAAVPKGFDPQNNANGAPEYDHGGYVSWWGAVPAGSSDRPDGEFCNVITTNNLLDLRRHVTPQGIDLAAELQFQMQSLLDGNIRTWSVDTSSKQDLGGDSGDVSTRYLICNEIGRSNGSGGVPPISGDTQRGPLVRSFDHIARRFGDQPVVERVVVAFWPGDRSVGPAVAPGTVNTARYVSKIEDPGAPGVAKNDNQWYEGDVLHLDLEFLNATTLGGLFDARVGAGDGGGGSGIGLPSQNFLAFAPQGTVITDVLGAWHDDGNYVAAQDQTVQLGIVQGLGTTHLEVTLDANDTPMTGGIAVAATRAVGRDQGVGVWDTEGSARRIFLEVEITYPVGVGTTDTPDHEVVPDTTVYSDNVAFSTGPGPCIENSIAQRPADFENLLTPRFRSGFREIQSEYIANDTVAHGLPLAGTAIGTVTTEQIVSRNTLDVYFPRRVWSDAAGVGLSVVDAVTAAARIVDVPSTELGSSSRKVVLDGATPLSGAQTLCTVQYFAQDPVPNYGINGGGYQIGYYYRSNAPQTAGTYEGDIKTTGGGVLPTTLRVEPLLASTSVWTGQRGTGSHDLAYPYATPLDQIPIHDGTTIPAGPDFVAGTTEEWFFAASGNLAVSDFNADTGLLNLHAFVQQDTQGILTLGGAANTEYPRKDAEFRAFYPFADDTTYRPTIFAQPLYGATRHKVFTPFLARAVEDVPGTNGGLLFRKSELLLVVLSRFAELDDENTVRFSDPAASNRTLAAVYRTRNLLLTVGDRTCLGF